MLCHTLCVSPGDKGTQNWDRSKLHRENLSGGPNVYRFSHVPKSKSDPIEPRGTWGCFWISLVNAMVDTGTEGKPQGMQQHGKTMTGMCIRDH